MHRAVYKVTSKIGEVGAPAASANEEVSDVFTADILNTTLCTV